MSKSKKTITLPEISNYGNHSSSNYGAHTLRVDIGVLTVWYSYKTPVAFQVTGRSRVVHENTFSNTTGKHLNLIDGGGDSKKNRVNAETFETEWKKQVAPLLGM